MLRWATGFTAMANSDMDGGVPSDLRAQVRQVSEGSAGRGVGAPGAAGSVLPGGPPARRNTDMRAAMNTILHLFPVALHAVRPLSLALDGLQHFSKVSAFWHLGGNLGRVCTWRCTNGWPGGEPVGSNTRQPISQIRRKGTVKTTKRVTTRQEGEGRQVCRVHAFGDPGP